ncbi:MAG: molybdopterin-dependent oxidoreductase [Acidimicrobiales bacterium]
MPVLSGDPSAQSPTSDPQQVTFVLDGRETIARKGELVISAAERAGVYIPRFCYHPRMKPVGMCRMCLVEVAGPRGATLQPACFINVEDGAQVVTDSEKVKKAQDGILEYLLINHPLDCPVCDKGGECPLQDQTLAYGPGESRFVEEKRHFEKPVAISQLVLLDRERCIQCARCTRFAEEIAGEAQIDFAGRGERVEVAIFPGDDFTSYFSGNTVQICPVGALTATPYRFTARPWDLDQVESTCTTCAFGCRAAVQSSANRLTRLLGLDSDPVNHGWLCDKGRFAYEAVNGDEVAQMPSADLPAFTLGSQRPAGRFGGEVAETAEPIARVTAPMLKDGGIWREVSWSEALAYLADRLGKVREAQGPSGIALIGGGRLTNEGAYAWTKLAKSVIGTDSVDAQLGDGLPGELVLSLPEATIDEAATAKALVLITGDVREELPVLFLRLRRAALDKKVSIVELTQHAGSLSPYAAVSLAVRPGDTPAVARALAGDDAAAPGHPAGASYEVADLERARRLIAQAGEGGPAGSGVVVAYSRPSLAESSQVAAAAVSTLAAAWPAARFLPLLRRGNVRGALDMGMAPGVLPGRVSLEQGRDWFQQRWGSVPQARGRDAGEVLASLASGAREVRALLLVGCDPLSDFPDTLLAAQALEACELVVAVVGHPSPVTEAADLVLPVAVSHERPGTTTNIEGRVTRLAQKLAPPGFSWPDWMIAAALAEDLGADLGFGSQDAISYEIGRVVPAYLGFSPGLLEVPSGHDGVVVPLRSAPARSPSPIDPMAVPGVESVERQGAPPRVGLTGSLAHELSSVTPLGGAGSPPPLRPPAPQPVLIPAPDHYSLRLVSSRRLYDRGSAVVASPSLERLVADAMATANPSDLARLGVRAGEVVRVSSKRGACQLLTREDDRVPRGVLVVDFNLCDHGGDPNAAGRLIDAQEPVNEVRLETR